MRIRNVVAIAGVAGTLVMTQLMGSAFADPKSHSLIQAEQLLGVYAQTNQKVAACMKGKGLSYDARLAKLDVIDAYSVIPETELTDAIRAQVAAQTKAAQQDPNASLMGNMSPQTQSTWADAVNECSAKVDFELGGGAEGQAKVDAARRAALANPEVTKAAKVYVSCMRDQGFTVDLDPFVAPQAISDSEHGTSAAEIAMVDKYNSVWRTCVQPWQQAFDQKLFG